MTSRKRSAAGRGRLSVDIGPRKPAVESAAELLGWTLSEFIREALDHYQKPTFGVSELNLAQHRLFLCEFEDQFKRFRDDPSDPSALDDLQRAFDVVMWDAGYLHRQNGE